MKILKFMNNSYKVETFLNPHKNEGTEKIWNSFGLKHLCLIHEDFLKKVS